MGRRQRLRKEVREQAATYVSPLPPPPPLKLGNHTFRPFTGLDVAFGADIGDYPPFNDIPAEFRDGNTRFNKAVSSLFFKGGALNDFGLKLRDEVHPPSFYAALKAMLGSFAPKHEHKEAACAWLLAEYTEAS